MSLLERLMEIPERYERVILDTTVFCYNKPKEWPFTQKNGVIPRTDYYNMLIEIIKLQSSITISNEIFEELKKARKNDRSANETKKLVDCLSGYKRIVDKSESRSRMASFRPSVKAMRGNGLSEADISCVHLANYYANEGIITALITNDKSLRDSALEMVDNLSRYSIRETVRKLDVYSQFRSGSGILILNNDHETIKSAIRYAQSLESTI